MTHASEPASSPDAPAFDTRELAAATGGQVLAASPRPIRGGAVDSRQVQPGNCFFALPGERTDGHRFLREAVRAGAAALVVTLRPGEREQEALVRSAPAGVTIVHVSDALRALHGAARAWRARFEPLVVGVTGSIAKTSTKEAIAETLSERWTVLRNEGNENNEVGLPLTLLRLAPEHRAAVLEMGMYVPGEIALLADLARPGIGVVTAVRGIHLSRASTLDAIERGKGELVEALPADGTVVLNADDARVLRMRERTHARTLSYGFGEDADVTAGDVRSLGEHGMTFLLRVGSERAEAEIPVLGRHSVHNALGAAAAATAAGLDLPTIVRGLRRGFRAPHRNTLLRAGEWRILDDSYNAAPDSMAAALELLSTLPGRRIAALGEMLELGDESDAAHRELGRRAADIVDALVLVGHGVEPVAEGAVEAGLPATCIEVRRDIEDAAQHLTEFLRPGDVLLVKGSRGVGLDRLVERLVAAAGGVDAAGAATAARGGEPVS